MMRKVTKTSVSLVYRELVFMLNVSMRRQPRTTAEQSHIDALSIALRTFEKGFSINEKERQSAHRAAVRACDNIKERTKIDI